MAINTYNQSYNYDNSVLRYIIVSLLAELNDKVFIYQRTDNETLEKVSVPFMYSVTGSERFLKDEFLYDSLINGKAIGDYEHVPRCVIQLSGVSIDSSSQTNKFVQSKFVREVNGELKTFYMRTCYLPLNLTFECTTVCSNQLEMLKITEAVMCKLYSVNLFYVDFGMMTMQASYTLPTDYSQERTTDFSLNEKKEYNVGFGIEVKSFMPVFEHGLTLDEIDYMLKDVGEGSVVMLREDEYGNVGLRTGGLLTEFRSSTNTDDEQPQISTDVRFDTPPKKDLLSNTPLEERNKNYTIKPAGYNEKQNRKF